VEWLINRLKQFRRVATRYEKRAANYQAMVTLAAILLWLQPWQEGFRLGETGAAASWVRAGCRPFNHLGRNTAQASREPAEGKVPPVRVPALTFLT
jgi:hypothetical protein